jgi:hypothetical protein
MPHSPHTAPQAQPRATAEALERAREWVEDILTRGESAESPRQIDHTHDSAARGQPSD